MEENGAKGRGLEEGGVEESEKRKEVGQSVCLNKVGEGEGKERRLLGYEGIWSGKKELIYKILVFYYYYFLL